MSRLIRHLLVACCIFFVFSGRVDAASVTLAWDPNPSADNVTKYHVGYRTSSTGNETVVDVGNVTTWTFTSAVAGSTYFFRVFAENQAGVRSAPSNEVSTTIPTTPPPPSGGGLALERGSLNYGAVQSSGTTLGPKTPTQRVGVTQTASGSPVAWTAASVSSSRITVSPTSGSGTGAINVTLASTSLAVGNYTDTVRVTTGSTQLDIPITTRVYAPGSNTPPVGSFDTPVNGVTNVAGAIPVTGWGVDDVAVSRVDIYRDPVGGEAGVVFLGSASIIAGARPDIEASYPTSPLNYRTGWGFMVLTNMLPGGGNGAYRLHAYVIDAESQAVYLGAKNITANNAASVKPFGTIDTPAQGGTVSGSAFVVFGWALTPQPAIIPTNGSTITVYVDGVARGNPVYNNNRSDISTLFPGLRNTNGAIGYYVLNTTTLANGTHTMSWTVTDDRGNTEGIGSRFFTVQNGSGALTKATVQGSAVAGASAMGETIEMVSEVPPEYSVAQVKKPTSDDQTPETVFPEWSGELRVRTVETEQVEVRLGSQVDDGQVTYEGYVVMGGHMRPLPIGSSLNTTTGTFTWQPGPGFIGRYQFVFLRTGADGFKTRIPVSVRISPKTGDDDRR
jgi:Fibronectin type III domain